jgi:hypothetical protein
MAIPAKPRTLPNLFDIPLKSVAVRRVDSRTATRPPARELVERVRGEFNELRGFSPTLEQAARLFSLSQDECHHVFAQLLSEGFLGLSADGRFRLAPRR